MVKFPSNKESRLRGARLAAENAKAILGDADILAERLSYGRAVSLAVLAGEEAAKAIVLWASGIRDLPPSMDPSRVFSSHRSKQRMLQMGAFVNGILGMVTSWVNEAAASGDLDRYVDNNKLTAAAEKQFQGYLQNSQTMRLFQESWEQANWWLTEADRLKQHGFYVGPIGQNRWSTPLTACEADYVAVREKVSSFVSSAVTWANMEEGGAKDKAFEDIIGLFGGLFTILGLAIPER